jgi:uncharacterized phage protein (TIGR02218 family)
MPLTLPAALDTAVKFEVMTLCRLIEVTRQDGFVLRLTDCDRDVVINGVIYRSDIGFTASALLVGLNLNQTQGMTLTVGLSEEGVGGMTKRDLRTRRYSAGSVVLYECDYTQAADTQLAMFKGIVGRVTYTDTNEAQIEVLPFSDDTAMFADQVYSQTCRASLGDSRCGFPIESFAVNFVVTAVTSLTTFQVDTFGPTAAGRPDIDYFAEGQMKWLTGDNAAWECDVLTGNLSTRTFTSFFPVPAPIKVGDTGRVYPGCNRQLSTCHDKFDNVLNYRGEPFAPQWGV